jgi:hypothetical protein
MLIDYMRRRLNTGNDPSIDSVYMVFPVGVRNAG